MGKTNRQYTKKRQIEGNKRDKYTYIVKKDRTGQTIKNKSHNFSD